MKILVCGGRDYNDYREVKNLLNYLNDKRKITTIISGCARGADRLGEQYAEENNISVMKFPAHWNKYGKRAGYLRNVQMAEEGKPDMILAFPGGRGTAMMIQIGKERNIYTREINR